MTIAERLDKLLELLPDDEISINIPIRVLKEWLNEPKHVVMDLTVEEVAEKLGNRSPGTIRNWCNQGLIPEAYKLNGREWRIPPAALNALKGEKPKPRIAMKEPVVDIGSWRKYVG